MHLLQSTLEKIKPEDPKIRSLARKRLNQLTMPEWALGRLMDLALDIAAMTGTLTPGFERKTIVTMAADHGVAREGVSKYPQEVTAQMLYNFARGGAAINALARSVRAEVVVVDFGVLGDFKDLVQEKRILSKRIGPGTLTMLQGPAMTRDQAVQSLESGIELALDLAKTTDIFGTGDMGIGNTTPSAAVASVLMGLEPEDIVGHGTGIDDTQRKHKVAVIQKSLKANQPERKDAVDVLSKVGGFEIGGIAGLILGAASLGKPVIIDGFISTAGALLAFALRKESANCMIASHCSMEKGHRRMLEHLNKKPLLDLEMRLGEGTGAALAMPLVESSIRVLTEVATFEEAAVSKASL